MWASSAHPKLSRWRSPSREEDLLQRVIQQGRRLSRNAPCECRSDLFQHQEGRNQRWLHTGGEKHAPSSAGTAALCYSLSDCSCALRSSSSLVRPVEVDRQRLKTAGTWTTWPGALSTLVHAAVRCRRARRTDLRPH